MTKNEGFGRIKCYLVRVKAQPVGSIIIPSAPVFSCRVVGAHQFLLLLLLQWQMEVHGTWRNVSRVYHPV